MLETKLRTKVFQDPLYFIAFGFGAGLLPKAPGTWGTLVAIPLYLLLSYLSPVFYLLCVFLFFVVGVWISDKVSRELGVEDHSGIVWDEVVGYLLTMWLVPRALLWIVLGFLLFRFFDVLKPYPICLADKHIKGGLGVMLDDVLAAVAAGLILHFLLWNFA